ncbi:hypothetical protein PFDG_04934 [Plasmodium falciparum Dd2]|uniref:Uncharacterized protein n=1 Tax=Plasmodium falciparum (isolate Dd2) TaxID=57267 RepID=A0A0L7M940_PLAF4|nr:hypothetical protein PFDG_04934 [Plasmodium falciparum Dd2]
MMREILDMNPNKKNKKKNKMLKNNNNNNNKNKKNKRNNKRSGCTKMFRFFKKIGLNIPYRTQNLSGSVPVFEVFFYKAYGFISYELLSRRLRKTLSPHSHC